MAESYKAILLDLVLEHGNLSFMGISQDNVVTRLRRGGTFNNDLIANLPTSPSVKEFLKSVSVWRSYRREFVLFF